MKTINSNTEDVEIFIDQDAKKYIGFAGIVQVYDADIYVDTRDGAGYDKVMAKFEKLIKFLGSKYKFRGFAQEDTRQHIAMRILEGIPKYDPRKATKLSTFIQMRVNRRLINELRDERHAFKNATSLNINSCNYLCSCGHSFNMVMSEEELIDKDCAKCGSSLNTSRKISIGFSEVSLEGYFSHIKNSSMDEDCGDFELIIENEQAFGEDDIILKHDVEKWLSGEDPEVVKLIELILLNDNNISSAAKEINLSNASANIKLKKLKNNRIIRDVLGK